MNNPDTIVFYILGYIAIFVIGILITRAVFSIGTIVANLKAQKYLLIKMAEKQGVTKEEIDLAIKPHN